MLICTHATTATANLIRATSSLGARVTYVPISYRDWRPAVDELKGIQNVTVIDTVEQALVDTLPETDVIFEDGMRVSGVVYANPSKYPRKPNLYGIEQTSSGIKELEIISRDRMLYPVFNLAASILKTEIENAGATPESVLSLLITKESFVLEGKAVLVIGYGPVGVAGAQNTTGPAPTLRRGIQQPSHEQDRPALVVLYYEYERVLCDKISRS